MHWDEHTFVVDHAFGPWSHEWSESSPRAILTFERERKLRHGLTYKFENNPQQHRSQVQAHRHFLPCLWTVVTMMLWMNFGLWFTGPQSDQHCPQQPTGSFSRSSIHPRVKSSGAKPLVLIDSGRFEVLPTLVPRNLLHTYAEQVSR